ncbi:MAG: hypothetical protein MNPFHGCM_00165 [Gemmatimonadaceae bacterium]|nr:hypothetical protein [Gemmatimonadaceae bacterium]
MSNSRGMGSPRHTLRLALVAGSAIVVVLANGCGLALSGTGRAPSPTDSLLAQGALQAVVDQFVSNEQQVGAPTVGPPLGERAVREGARFSRALIRRLDWIDVSALNEADYVTLLSIRSALDGVAERAQFFENDLATFAAASPFARLVYVLSGLMPRDSADVAVYASMLTSLAAYADTLRADLTRRESQGIVLSQSAIDRAIGMLAPAEGLTPDNMLRLSGPRTRLLDDVSAWHAMAQADSAIARDLVPAVARLLAFLRGDYGSRGPRGIGLWQYVGGREYYRALVRAVTTLDVTPEQTHGVGLREVARLSSAMQSLRARIAGFDVPADSFHAALRRDARYGAITPDDVADRVLFAQSELPILDDSGIVAPGNYPIVTAPAMAVPGGDPVFGFYRQPNARDSSAQYTPSPLMMKPGLSILLEPLSYFAISPGRHDLLGRRLAPGRDVARWYANVPAFSDGWGLYALDLLRDTGALTDSLQQYGALMLETIAAVRLVVDGGIHYFGWTSEQASAYIREHTMLDSAEALAEVMFMAHDAPGLGLAAAMGVHEIRGVRRWLERELGKDFDIRRFNRELRSSGPVPLQALGRHFEWWLWQERERIRELRTRTSERSRPQGQGPTTAPAA